ncbi:MAG: hypothetical protein K0Q73_7486 [Paenibacillus sp.]|nr:hypothetical protein [Paenibacillus sp.]
MCGYGYTVVGRASVSIALKSYSLAKDATQTVTNYVKPGAGNDDDLKVSVLLKVPSVSNALISSVQAAGNTISLAFSEGGYSATGGVQGYPAARGESSNAVLNR